MNVQAPYPWVKKVEEGLSEAKIVPLWGAAPPFPWEECATRLSQVLNVESLRLQPQDTQVLSYDELLSGLGVDPLLFNIDISPFSESVYWAMSSRDVEKLILATLSHESLSKSFSDRQLQEGFYAFLTSKAMYAVDSLKAFGNLGLQLGTSKPLLKGEALCLNIGLQIKDETLWGRLIVPASFLKVFRQYFSQVKSLLFNTEIRQQVTVDLHFEIGRIPFFLHELQRMAVGDFILLTHGSFDLKTDRGIVTAFLENTPLFRGELAKKQITILDYSFYHEEDILMSKKDFNDDDDFEEEENDEDIEEENDEDIEEENDEDIEEEEEEENFDEEDEEFEEEPEEEELSTPPRREHATSPPPPKAESTRAIKEVITAEKIPVTLSVEIAALRMTLEKLLELKPGNVLDLEVGTADPVSLKVNGKTVAKGELLRLGELLGVKILKIGEL